MKTNPKSIVVLILALALALSAFTGTFSEEIVPQEAQKNAFGADGRRIILIISDDENDTVLEDLMDRNVIFASTTEDQESVSEKFSDYDLMALPVVDGEGRLVGIVTVDAIIDVMEQEATEDFEKMAGILPSDKPYSRTSTVEMWKNRIPWLLFLMLSATFNSMILPSFED